jgi:arabinogalactan endo-1,4-beta-galactosidase
MSYYTGWSSHTFGTVGNVVNQLRHRFGKEVLIAETAYPWTLGSVSESAGNIINGDFLEEGYPATPTGQRDFLIDLNQSVLNGGGLGIIYWEPAWVSTDCRTLWGQGSHWENATFFDFRNQNEVLEGIEFLSYPYTYPIEVRLIFEFAGGEQPETIYFRGDFTGMGRRLLQLTPNEQGQYVLHTRLLPDTEIHYQFFADIPASEETALLAGDCVGDDGTVTMIIPTSQVEIFHTNNQCPTMVVE